MKEVVIRLPELKDAQGLANVHIKTWQYAYRDMLPDDYLDNLSIEKCTANWQDNIQNPKPKIITLVAEINNTIVGFCGIGPSQDEDVTSNTGELFAIYVDQNYMRQGVGSKLMDEALNKLKEKGYKKATLWVITENFKARKFYEKKGWIVDNKTKIQNFGGKDVEEIRYKINL